MFRSTQLPVYIVSAVVLLTATDRPPGLVLVSVVGISSFLPAGLLRFVKHKLIGEIWLVRQGKEGTAKIGHENIKPDAGELSAIMIKSATKVAANDSRLPGL